MRARVEQIFSKYGMFSSEMIVQSKQERRNKTSKPIRRNLLITFAYA